MEIIGNQKIGSMSDGKNSIKSLSCNAIRKESAYFVDNYMQLAMKIVQLQFLNRDFVFMFRGQANDYKNRLGNSSLKPSMLRGEINSNKPPAINTLNNRFEKLIAAEKALVNKVEQEKVFGRDRIKRQRIIRWAILQHYEICTTPLLDVTQSLRIAASFASSGDHDEAFVFILGVPQVSGAITASAEVGIQIVRLASVCPPSAVRPHIQEGYLLAEYPDCANSEQKLLYSHSEMDFGRRLIAKFRFNPKQFWKSSDNFPKIHKKALYPENCQDPMHELAEDIKALLA